MDAFVRGYLDQMFAAGRVAASSSRRPTNDHDSPSSDSPRRLKPVSAATDLGQPGPTTSADTRTSEDSDVLDNLVDAPKLPAVETRSVSPEIDAWLSELRSTRTRKALLDKWAPRATLVDGGRKFANTLKTQPTEDSTAFEISSGMVDYYYSLVPKVRFELPFRVFTIKDIALRELAGTGS